MNRDEAISLACSHLAASHLRKRDFVEALTVIWDTAQRAQRERDAEIAIPRIEWIAIAEDDFSFEWGKYMLRVEQMNKHSWWWCVYKGEKEYAGFDEPRAKTELEAKLLAEICFIRAILKGDKA